MLEIISQYWLNFLLGIISGGLILLCKKFWKMYQNEKEYQRSEEHKKLYEELQSTILENREMSRKEDKVLQEQIDIIKSGILSLQGRTFKQECRQLLNERHEITLGEFELIQEEHNTYNALGGNHDGDELFDMVKEKAINNITM